MSFIDLVRFAAGNLWRRRMRTFLTILGVIIGTICITIMIALGLGSLEQFNENIMQDSNLTRIEVYSGGGSQARLDTSAIERFRQISGVKSATGVSSLPAYIVMGKYQYSGSIYAVDPEAMDFEFAQGKVFAQTGALEFVVGSNAREYFQDPREMQASYSGFYGFAAAVEMDGGMEEAGPDVDWLEEQVTYTPSWGDPQDEESTAEHPAPKSYRGRICGVLAHAENMESYNIYISHEAAQRIYNENRRRLDSESVNLDRYENAYVNAQEVDDVQGILDTIKGMGFQVYSDTEWIHQMQDEQRRQQSQLIAIGLISLLVSAIGIANTMLASILERRREIGVMKVIGLSVGKIHLMFLVEAAMIGLLGGIIGIIISYIIAAAAGSGDGSVNLLGMYFDQGVRMSIPWWLSLGAVAIAAGVGIISGIYPAWKATRLSPLEAIRGAES